MGFLQFPKEIKIVKGQDIEIKLSGNYPKLFYARIIVQNNIFNLPEDILTIENGLIYKGIADIPGVCILDIEQVWGAELDPSYDYICNITIENIIEPDTITKETKVPEVLQVEYTLIDTIQEPNQNSYDFDGFLTKSLKKNINPNDNSVSIVIKSDISQTLSLKTSDCKLDKTTVEFKNINEPTSIFFTFPKILNKGLIYGLKLSYLSKVVNIMLPAGIFLNSTDWKEDLLNQLLLLSELDQLEWSWVWENNKLHATASQSYHGYKVEWLTSPDINLSNSFFSEPYSDDTQIVQLYLGKDNYWIEKTITLELDSTYKAKNSKLELKLFNTTNEIFIVPQTTVLIVKEINRIYFTLNSVLSTDFNGTFNIKSNTLKKWSDVKLLKDTINISAGNTTDYIEIQTLKNKVGKFELIFEADHKNMLQQKWCFEIPSKPIVKNKRVVEFIFTTLYKNDTIFIYATPKQVIESAETVDVIIGTDKISLSLEPGFKTAIIKYRKIVIGLLQLSLKIKDKSYSVLAYDDTMPVKLLNIGGLWKLSKPLPIEVMMLENDDKFTLLSTGQSWLPGLDTNTTKVSFKTSSGQLIFSQEINKIINPPVIQLKIVNNTVIVETNYLPSQPIHFTLNWNYDIIQDKINMGEKNWYRVLKSGQHSFKLTSTDVTVINSKIDVWI
jgi:hypothetical protein